MEGWGINLLWRDIVRPAILVGKYRIQESPAFRHGEYANTDDGSYGIKGFVTTALQQLIDKGIDIAEVVAIGPVIMMKTVADTTRPYNIKTIVSLNPIMVDGTGMCGGCRVQVGDETKFACVDGSEFDGHLVDFVNLMERQRMYRPKEEIEKDHICRLVKKVEEMEEK